MRQSNVRLLAGLAITIGCSTARVTPSATPAVSRIAPLPSGAPAATAQPNAIPTTSAALPAALSTPRASDAVAPLKNVELLHTVPARVAVSSAVRNPRDFPEYLVDNHLETAWNSHTGDLVGGWIEFQIPADATVRRLEMNCGFSRVKGKSDLFLQNHRIRRVEVLHDGKSVGEYPLDVNQRGLQVIPVAGAGGIYRIVVTATVPGTRKDWRELAVSELRVMGDPGKELRAPGDQLQVAVGALENASPQQLRETGMAIRDYDAITDAFESPEKLCAEFVKKAKAGANVLLEEFRDYVHKLDAPFCYRLPDEQPLPENPTYTHAVPIRLSDGLITRSQLAVKVARGFVLVPVSWAAHDPTDPGCPSIFRTEKIEPLRVENGYLVITETGRRFYDDPDTGKRQYWTLHGATWCREADSKLACSAYDPSNVGSLEEFSIGPDGQLHVQGPPSN